jgi:hypothetical protein
MRSWLAPVVVATVMGTASAGCDSGTPTASPTTTVAQTTLPFTTVSPTTMPITTIPAACNTDGSGGPVETQLDPYLLTLEDVPNGYTTPGPETVNSSPPEFAGVVPMSVPIAYITFTMGDAPAGPSSVIVEALDRTMSPQQAESLLSRINSVDTECGDEGEQTVDLPGPVPNLVATIGNGGSSIQDLLAATVCATKGPFLLEVSWFNGVITALVKGVPPPLPTPAVMGSVVDAALAHIPG